MVNPEKSKVLKEWITPLYLDTTRLDLLSKKYAKADPYPHASFSSFLLEAKAQELKEALSKIEYTKKQSDLFSLSQTGDLQDSKDKTLKSFVKLLKARAFRSYIEQLTGEKLSSKIDVHSMIYEDSDYLLCHDDRLEGRKIAFVFNLSKDFTKRSGGDFALLSSDNKGRPSKIAKVIPPEWNTFTLFTVTDTSHHLVEEVLEDKKRLTIGGWLHG